jgi:hypothetical protein
MDEVYGGAATCIKSGAKSRRKQVTENLLLPRKAASTRESAS